MATVITNKTKTIIFQNDLRESPKTFITYKNVNIDNVKEYKYLGCLIKSNDLIKKARKVLFLIKSYTSEYGQLPVNVVCNLFDTLVRPILTYNAEIGFMDQYLKYNRAKLLASKTTLKLSLTVLLTKLHQKNFTSFRIIY